MKRTEFKEVDVDSLIPNPLQPREGFDKESIGELANSLKSVGDIQPVVVRKVKNGYQIIAGERRWRAAKTARLRTIPVLVKDTPEEDVLLESLIENVHRKDLESVERESAVYELWVKFGPEGSKRWKIQGELADALGKSRTWVQQNIKAAEIRKEEKLPADIATKTISVTASLEKTERKQFLERVKEEKIPEGKAEEYTSVIAMAKESPELKRAILATPQRMTPPVARQILTLPKEKQASAVKQIQVLRLEEPEAIAHVQSMKTELPLPPPEEFEKVRERYQILQKDIRARLETPEAKERGALFKNWTAHIAVMGALNSLFCPVDRSGKLGWLYKGEFLPIEKALSLAEDNYQKSVKGK